MYGFGRLKNLAVHCELFLIKSLELMEVDWHRLDLIKNGKVTRKKNPQTLIREHSLLVTRETTEEPTQKANIIQALKFVDANYSLESSYDDSERFKVTFPGSEIAKNYQQGAIKIQYNIQFGIAPTLKNHYCTMLRMCLFLSSSMKQQQKKFRSNMMLMLILDAYTGRKSKT